jgi:inosose dehydratase
MKYGYVSNAWGSVVGHPVGVTSIKDLFYLSTGSTPEAVRDIAQAGYRGLEIFDGNLIEFEGDKNAFRRLMLDHKLELVAVYTGANFIYSEILREELWRIERAAAIAAELGAKHLTVGGGAKRSSGTTDDDYWRLAEGLDRAADIAERHGLTASYHPHLTTIVETPAQLEQVMRHSRINLCPDTAHLAAGGGDPALIVRQYANRIKHVHLKGFQAEPFAFTRLDSGTLDNAAVLHALEDVGYDGWVIVEADGCAGDPRENAALNFQYLQTRASRVAV